MSDDVLWACTYSYRERQFGPSWFFFKFWIHVLFGFVCYVSALEPSHNLIKIIYELCRRTLARLVMAIFF